VLSAVPSAQLEGSPAAVDRHDVFVAHASRRVRLALKRSSFFTFAHFSSALARNSRALSNGRFEADVFALFRGKGFDRFAYVDAVKCRALSSILDRIDSRQSTIELYRSIQTTPRVIKLSLKLTMLKWTKSILSWLTSVSIFRITTEQFIGRSMRLGKPGLVT